MAWPRLVRRNVGVHDFATHEHMPPDLVAREGATTNQLEVAPAPKWAVPLAVKRRPGIRLRP